MKKLAFLCPLLLAFAPRVHAQNAEFHNPPELAAPNGYTHAVVVNRGKLVFVSGQVGLDKDGKVAGDFAAQARQAFANLKTALAAVGARPSDLVKLNYYVVGLNHDKLVALREARDAVIDKAHPPASTLAGVQALFREDVQVEIEAEAVLP
ncbi:RidA family protein [Acidobacteria bacterium AB60]|nr:RidA family protein [Acidobacteria bacterium AB60]